MLSAVVHRLRRLFAGPRRAVTPDLPRDRFEAGQVYGRWDGSNGRYYFTADVVLDDDTFLQDLTFDGDTLLGVEVGRRRLEDRPDLFGRRIVAWLVVRDCSPGRPFGDATPEQRSAFRAAHT